MTATLSPEVQAFCRITDLDEAHTAVNKLSIQDKIALRAVDPSLFQFLDEGDSFHFSLLDPNKPTTTQKQVNQLCRQLLDYVEKEKAKADARGVPFQIILGDYHTCRNTLIVSLLLEHIVSYLGIDNIGIEKPNEEFEFETKDRETIRALGLKKLVSSIGTETIPNEKNPGHSAFPDYARMNDEYYILQANRLRMNIFSNDPLHKWCVLGSKGDGNPSHKDNYETRETATEDLFKEMAMDNKSFLSIHGSAHLPGLSQKKDLEKYHCIFINPAQKNSLETQPKYRPNNIEVIGYPSALLTADGLIDLGNTGPVIHAILPGGGIEKLATKEKEAPEIALEMAQEAIRQVLEIDLEQQRLDTMQIGAEVPVKQDRRRA